ncbi:hypothetical protein MY11210_004996 [Beauveria gryllotalpidicola]
MSDSKHDSYSDIIDEEEHDAFLGSSSRRRAKPEVRAKVSWLLYAALSFTLLLVGGAIGYNARRITAARGLAFADMSQFNIYNGIDFAPFEQRFNGSLFKRSPYSGPPSPEMDKTWGRFTEMGSSMLVKIDEDDARASTSYSLETAVHLEETQNIGYMASLGFFHQIHCLNMLRKFIYLDYYKEKTPGWFSQPYLRGHADHCVDMLREAIMCHGDTTLIVYHWVDGYSDPVPDFSTMSYSDIFPGSASSNLENATLWDALQPRGGGFIAVPDPRELGLVGGFPLGEEANEERPREGYGISMFHQIHCLVSSLYDLCLRSTLDAVPFKVALRTAIRTRTFDDQHLDHCLDYLRQAIMCTGDTTLEKVVVDDNGQFKPDIDGWGTVHECRSWHMLFEFAERQRVKVVGD